MASDHSMDVAVEFDFQELKNAVEQAKKEATNRYDLKNSDIEIELSEEAIKVTAESKNQIEAVYTILLSKMISRSVSPKVLDRQEPKEVGGMRVRQEMKLVKALDSEQAKKIAKIVRDEFPKAKPVINGDSVRISSKSIDDLQQIMAKLRADEGLGLPLDFSNFK